MWGFHVATAVRAEEGGWWILDTTFSRPMSSSAWIAEMKRANRLTKDLTLYVTEADRVLPNPEFDPKDPQYRGFFRALYDSYSREHQERASRSRRYVVPQGNWPD
jgi:hypothetical protein